MISERVCVLRSHASRSILISTKDLLHHKLKYYPSYKVLRQMIRLMLQGCYTASCQDIHRFNSYSEQVFWGKYGKKRVASLISEECLHTNTFVYSFVICCCPFPWCISNQNEGHKWTLGSNLLRSPLDYWIVTSML